MSTQSHGPLGQNQTFPEQYDPSVLFPIPRQHGRDALGIVQPVPFYGEDIWNAYEVSWLNPKGKPLVALLELRVPAQSVNIVESKSLKLYLGSFNQTRMASPQQVAETLLLDIGKVTQGEIRVNLSSLDDSQHFNTQALPGRNIDHLDVEINDYGVNAQLLTGGASTVSKTTVSETLNSHLLRSCCPVTGQPDWASVLVQYQGAKIDEAGLLKYLISFRQNQEFHEQCVERIYHDIQTHCQPNQLLIYARYTRRGGIDINPVRASEPVNIDNWRTLRQ